MRSLRPAPPRRLPKLVLVDVVGRRDSGLYQDSTNYGVAALITESRTWFVNTNSSVVRFHEVLASNAGAFVHSNTTPDAIELRNASASPVNLEGMRLTDDPNDPDKFTLVERAASFPLTDLGAISFLRAVEVSAPPE